MKKHIFILIAIFVQSTISFSQEIEWSNLTKKKGNYPTFYNEGGKNFYGISYSNSLGIVSSVMMNHYSGFLINGEQKIQFEINGRRSNYEGSILVKDQMLVFMSQEDAGSKKLYYKIFDSSCLPVSEEYLIAEYSNEKGSKRYSSFNLFQSQNKEYFCVQYSVPGKKTDTETFGYKIYNSNLQMTGEGIYDSPFTVAESDLHKRYLSNSGDLFIGMKVYTMKDNGKINSRVGLQAYMIYLLKGNEMASINMYELGLQLDNRVLSDMTFTASDKRILTCTGLYGTSTETAGAFYFKIDFDEKKFVEEGYNEFTKEFITSDWSDREKAKAQRKEDKGKGAPTLYNYDFRDVFETEDGGLIVVMEQYYMYTTTTTDSRGGVRYTDHYVYNDVIVYKVQSDGSFDWVQKINKAQHTTNDGGYLSSVAGYHANGKYVLYFNDNIGNYNDFGQFETGTKGILSSSQSTRKNCVAKVDLDLSDGAYKRELFTSKKESSAYCVPKRFSVDYSKNEMLLYFQYRSKEKFGLLSF